MTASSSPPKVRTTPTSRITPRRQLEISDLVGRLGNETQAEITAEMIHKAIGIAPKSSIEAAAFFVHAGLFRPGHRAWSPTELGKNLSRLRVEDPTRARLLLRDAWQDMWFNRRARQILANGPLPEADLARRLQTGLPGRPERGLYLVEWMSYALLVERTPDNDLMLPAAARPNDVSATAGAGVLDPLLRASVEQISALSEKEFIALMDGYRAILQAFSPRPDTTH
ncbi:hypothetical protein OG211_14735 [Streptomyces niveus]|uniref:hypothetical protein n=1 Tax=Streptomyces niveus TaxID=193462 RepID=UPI00386B4003|nr:hypothetical protein OG211_14735 [Streptomyces niveus]